MNATVCKTDRIWPFMRGILFDCVTAFPDAWTHRWTGPSVASRMTGARG